MTTNNQIRNTYVYGVNPGYADNQIRIQRANAILPELHAIPESIEFRGLTIQTRAELAIFIANDMLKSDDMTLSEKQLPSFLRTGTMRLGTIMPGFIGGVAEPKKSTATAKEGAQLTSADALQQAIKQAIHERVAEYKRLLELSCQDVFDNASQTIANLLDSGVLDVGALQDTSLIVQPLDLPLERIKAIALSEKYSDMLKSMVSDLSSYKPMNARVLSDSLAVDIVLTNDAQKHALSKDGYVITPKANSIEAEELQTAMQTAMQASEWGKVASIGVQLDKLKTLFIVSKAI